MKRLLLCLFSGLLLEPVQPQPSSRGLGTSQQADSLGTSYALVIGISQYAYINPLQYADDDADLFADYLVKQKVCERKNVIKLIDAEATRVSIFRQLKWLGDQLRNNDRVFIYFAGHGDVETDIEKGYFLPYDCLSNNYSATGIDLRSLEDYVNLYFRKNAKVVLITDACRSGNLTGGISGASLTMSSLALGFNNVVKIVSCQPNQLSLEKQYPEGGHGVFTYHLVDGLNGLADRDNDSSICLREIDIFLENVRTETNKKQTPKVEGDMEKNIARFDKQLFLALLAKKKTEENLAVNHFSRYRGPGDSSWEKNPVYQEFMTHIGKRRLTGEDGENALAVLKKAKNNKEPGEMISEMNLELGAVLEDQAQRWINKYLRGDLGSRQQEILSEVKEAAGYLQAVEQLYGTGDLRYPDIHVKKIFFEAYYTYASRNRPAFDSTLSVLLKAAEQRQNQAWLYNLCGNFFRVLGKNAEAEKAYRDAMRISPSWSYPWLGMAVLYRFNLQNDSAAEMAYKKVVQLNPFYVAGWNEMGKFYASKGRIAEAESAYRGALRADSLHFPDTWLDLGNLYYDQKKFPEAETAFQKAIAIDPGFAYPWNNLGNLYLVQKKIPEAESAFQKAIDLLPGYPDPCYSLGSLQVLEGKTEKALSLLERAFQNGFIQFEFLDKDPDWNAVRDTEAYKTLLGKYRK